MDFHQKRKAVSGYLTFGVDDAYPRNQEQSFAREAELLREAGPAARDNL